ncbi:MAG: hypothetical protein ACYTGX_09115 [Planctomycetota bacterium]
MRRRHFTRPHLAAAAITLATALVGVPLSCAAVLTGGEAPAGPGTEAPGTPAATAQPLERLDRVEGWVPYWGDPERTAVAAARHGVTDLLFFGATLKPDGRMKMESARRMREAVAAAHADGARSWLTVANHGQSLAKVLTPANRAALAARCVDALARSGCRHLDLDLEQLTRSQTAELVPLAEALGEALPQGARLGITLQPVDARLRPWAIPHVRALLANPRVFTVRFMCYDYHWRTSLPGALYPRAVYERLLATYPEYAAKLCMALPLYGYAWPRPDDVSLPSAGVVTLAEVDARARAPHTQLLWMEADAELALITRTPGGKPPVWAAVPSLRAIGERAALARYHGVPAIAFWHLGCGKVGEAVAAARGGLGADAGGDPPSSSLRSWAVLLAEWKERTCKRITAKPGDSFAVLAKRHGVSRAALYRFNEGLTDDTLPGSRVYLPLRK